MKDETKLEIIRIALSSMNYDADDSRELKSRIRTIKYMFEDVWRHDSQSHQQSIELDTLIKMQHERIKTANDVLQTCKDLPELTAKASEVLLNAQQGLSDLLDKKILTWQYYK